MALSGASFYVLVVLRRDEFRFATMMTFDLWACEWQETNDPIQHMEPFEFVELKQRNCK